MTDFIRRTSWLVRAYKGERVIASWTIDNRTENEAYKEVSTDVAMFTDCDDWTLTSITKAEVSS